MRIGSGVVGAAQLYESMQLLKTEFDNIILVNPLEQSEIGVTEYGLQDLDKSCTETCPLANDKVGCICKSCLSVKENRCRYIYDKTNAYLVIAKPIKMRYKEYALVMIMRLNPAFQFGGNTESEAIESITKLSSSLVLDPLTKIFNRQYLMENVQYMLEFCLKQNKPMCLACIDIDNFKRFNDTYGHEFGDKVLKSVADNMVKCTTSLEDAYNIRIGGDEFVIVGVNVDKQRFKAVMNKLCITVDNTKLPYGKEMVSIKISIGVSELLSDRLSSYKELYNKADGQLYKAKGAGKGCVR